MDSEVFKNDGVNQRVDHPAEPFGIVRLVRDNNSCTITSLNSQGTCFEMATCRKTGSRVGRKVGPPEQCFASLVPYSMRVNSGQSETSTAHQYDLMPRYSPDSPQCSNVLHRHMFSFPFRGYPKAALHRSTFRVSWYLMR